MQPTDQVMLATVKRMLLALVWPDSGTTVFVDGDVVADRRGPQVTYGAQPMFSVSLAGRSFDGENPELGTYRLNLDLFMFDYTQPAGQGQMSAVETLLGAAQLIRDRHGNAVGAGWLSNFAVLSDTAPEMLDMGDGSGPRRYIWTMTITAEVMRG